jgi:EamA domain-containing membrane protein RarD
MSVSFSEIVILLIFIGGPILLPLLTKKRTWLITMIIGYVVYILWGVYLNATSDITEYGTGYGMFIVPYIIGISILGSFLQRNKNKNQKNM